MDFNSHGLGRQFACRLLTDVVCCFVIIVSYNVLALDTT